MLLTLFYSADSLTSHSSIHLFNLLFYSLIRLGHLSTYRYIQEEAVGDQEGKYFLDSYATLQEGRNQSVVVSKVVSEVVSCE